MKLSDNVYVLTRRGTPLMPYAPQKARVVLACGKARVRLRIPFTIRLTRATGKTRQPIALNVAFGYSHIGVSAASTSQELYSADLQTMAEMVKVSSERRPYRRFKGHYGTCWYHKPLFLNRRKPENWLTPSNQHKFDAHNKAVDEVKEPLPGAHIIGEVAAFDVEKIRNPEIPSAESQDGPQKDFLNVSEYVLYRDGHTCHRLKGKSKDAVLAVHQKALGQVTVDKPEDLITLAKTYHDKASQGEFVLDVPLSKGFKAETFMTTLRGMVVDRRREVGNGVFHTY